jgi:hypothetical protein
MTNMKVLSLVIFTCLGSSSALAITRAEICAMRAQLVGGIAVSRDNGKSQEKTLAEVKKGLQKAFSKVPASQIPDMRGYVEVVYANRDFTPEHIRLATEVSCLRGE